MAHPHNAPSQPWYNRVAWSEGLFLRPQLFQQQERYLESYAHRRAAASGPFFWGFSECEIDTSALALGKIGLAAATGVYSDGTAFEAPADTPMAAPFTIRQEHIGAIMCLAIHARQPGCEETSFEAVDAVGASTPRFGVFDVELRDTNSFGQGPKPVQLSHLRLRILPQAELGGNWIGIPFARIERIGADGAVEIDPAFIPSVRGFAGSPQLGSRLQHLHAVCRQRAEALAARLSASDGRAHESAEVADFLLLQILNRSDALMAHLLRVPQTPPEHFYTLLLGMSAEISTFVRTERRRPPEHRVYQHGDLHGSFEGLVADVQAQLNEVVIRSARQISLAERPNKVRIASIELAELQRLSNLVFAVAADMPAERLATEFAQHCKVAPSDRLAEVTRAHVPGIALQLLPVPPRQIPFNAGFVYFQVDAHGALWDHLQTHGGLALHLGTEFPGLRLELWGISKK